MRAFIYRSLIFVIMLIGGTATLASCGGAEGDSCSRDADCDNPDPEPLHYECQVLTCVSGICSKAGNEGVDCEDGVCNAEGDCVDESI